MDTGRSIIARAARAERSVLLKGYDIGVIVVVVVAFALGAILLWKQVAEARSIRATILDTSKGTSSANGDGIKE